MRIPTTTTSLIGAVALVLATAALLAPAAAGKPTPRQYGPPNPLGSQLDRLAGPSAASTTGPDAFERALVATEEESSRALRDVYSELVQPQSGASVAPPDVFERAVARRQAELAAAAAGPRALPAPATAGGGGGSLDWSLLVTLSAIAAACLALGGAALVSTRDRRRVSTS